MSYTTDPYTQGLNLFNQGHYGHAIPSFKEAIDKGQTGSAVWYALALSYQRLSQLNDAMVAVNNALKIDGADPTLLVTKADIHAQQGNKREALQVYRSAFAVCQSLGDLPDVLKPTAARAKEMTEILTQDIHAHLSKALADPVFNRISSRFDKSIALLKGEVERFEQQPRAHFYPELPCREFYSPSEFDWADKVNNAADTIRQELNALLAAKQGFVPYIHSDHIQAQSESTKLVNSGDWSAFHLIKEGQIDPLATQYCPQTLALFESLPLFRVDGLGPMLLFSKLNAKTKIPPHTGYYNSRLIVHLPLIVPDNCYLRVGSEERKVEQDMMMFFNDSINHEARNDSDTDRIVLIFDIWRPELSESERMGLAKLLSSIMTYEG